MKLSKLLPLLILFTTIFPSLAGQYSYSEQHEKAREHRAALASAKSMADSIRILYDVFDILPYPDRGPVAREILGIARRKGDSEVMGDMLRNLSVFNYRRPEVLDSLAGIANEIPDTVQRDGTRVFIFVEKATGESSFLNEEEFQKALMKYVKADLTPSDDRMQRLLDLYRVVIFIRNASFKGDLYLEYVTRLEKMISELPDELDYMKSVFYTTVAMYFTDRGFADKAVAADRALLGIIDVLEAKYQEKGRAFRNYNRNYYICYRRMLSNYDALTLEEVKDIYGRCALLAEKDEEVGLSFRNDPRPTAFRLLAEKNYAGAIPYLRSALLFVDQISTKELLVRRLIEASDSTGDHDTKLFALEEYNKIFSDTKRQNVQQAFTELQMRLNVSEMKAQASDMAMARKDLELETDRKIVSATLAALFLLVIAVMYLYRSYFSLLKRARDLEEDRQKLEQTVGELLDRSGNPQGSVDLRSVKSGGVSSPR